MIFQRFMQEDKPASSGAMGLIWKQYSRNQKIAFVSFIVCAVFLLFLTGASVMDGVQAPFRGSVADLIKNKDLLKDPVVEQENYSKRTDTDGDGISDWIEQNTYKTSPYLWSTAGDDVPDNVKIALGENPWCKHGEKCTPNPMRFDLGTTTLPYADLVKSQQNIQDVSSYISNNPNIKNNAEQAGVSLDLKSQVPKDPAIIRQALLDSGKVTKEELDKVSDEQLMILVNQAVSEAEQQQQQPMAKPWEDSGVTDGTKTNPSAGQASATSS